MNNLSWEGLIQVCIPQLDSQYCPAIHAPCDVSSGNRGGTSRWPCQEHEIRARRRGSKIKSIWSAITIFSSRYSSLLAGLGKVEFSSACPFSAHVRAVTAVHQAKQGRAGPGTEWSCLLLGQVDVLDTLTYFAFRSASGLFRCTGVPQANDDCPKDWTNMWEDDNDKSAMDLKWSGHVLLAHTHVIRQQYKDTMEGLEGRDDREARGVLEGLVKEFRAVNESQAALLTRMSNANEVLMEMLQKNEDGQASVFMGRAVDTLVKALAKAEEEVQSLKAALQEVEGQRDKYKRYLEKTNAELKLAPAYAQMTRARDEASPQRSAKRRAPVEDDVDFNPSIAASANGKQTRAKDRDNVSGVSSIAFSAATSSTSRRPTPTARTVRSEGSARTLRSARREQKKIDAGISLLEEAVGEEALSNRGGRDVGMSDDRHEGIDESASDSDGGGGSGKGDDSRKGIDESASDSDGGGGSGKGDDSRKGIDESASDSDGGGGSGKGDDSRKGIDESASDSDDAPSMFF